MGSANSITFNPALTPAMLTLAGSSYGSGGYVDSGAMVRVQDLWEVFPELAQGKRNTGAKAIANRAAFADKVKRAAQFKRDQAALNSLTNKEEK